MPEALTVVSVSAELSPWFKVGGLADVAHALPVALAARGHKVIGVAPRHRALDIAWDTGRTARFTLFGHEHEVSYFHATIDGVERVFVDHPALRRGGIYGDDNGAYGDSLFRYALFCRAAMEAPAAIGQPLPEDGAGTVFLAHDWHAALVPLYLSARYRAHGLRRHARSILAIHNMAHQGTFPMEVLGGLDLEHRWASTLEMGGALNMLKGGIVAADRVVTVSPRYAWEIRGPEAGFGLDGVLRMRGPVVQGILNGLDTREWDPANDPHQPAAFDARDLSGKALCKAALQQDLGLEVDPGRPLVGFVGRLDAQKGVDLFLRTLPWLRQQGAQVVMLGSGDPRLEEATRQAQDPTMRAVTAFSAALAHRITAASDLFVVPSRFEPCGLTQMQAMRYGTVPVVAATGGLVDSVRPYDPYAQSGTGWLFHPGSAEDLVMALGNALYTWVHWPDSFREIQRRGMEADWSWEQPAAQYEQMMQQALDSGPWA